MRFKPAKVKSRFTKNQKEAVAKLFDQFFQAFMLGATIVATGISGKQADTFDVCLLLSLAALFAFYSFVIRGGKEFQDAN